MPPTRIGTQTAAPEGTGQDWTGSDGTDGGEGRRAPHERAGRVLLTPQAARGRPGPAVTWLRATKVGPTGELQGEAKVHAPLALPGAVFPPAPLASLAPLPTSPSSHSRSSSAATWASRDTRLPRHVTPERPRGAGSRLFSPPAGSLTLSALAQWAQSTLYSGRDVILLFVPE